MTETFVSYAQNYEDVMLWRALKHVEHGFYIDVGAFSPSEASVTRAFYDRGWSGINIEPIPEFHGQLTLARPRDINLNVAISDRAGDLTLHIISVPGFSTLSGHVAQDRIREGLSVVEMRVPAQTLESIWAKHVASGQAVHFLKVDVEGLEREVLLGHDWSSHRPWLVVVEATRPNSMRPSHEAWEAILTSAGYSFAYGDGLNRFYVAGEHMELADAFRYPPNVFDAFIRAQEVEANDRAAQAEARAILAAAREANARAELRAMQLTRSWRMTAPLRAAVQIVRKARAALHRGN